MPAPLLATKCYVPPPRPGLVSRPHLVARLNEGLATGRKLTLVSASAGFGKTTLLSEWIADLRLLNTDFEKSSKQQSTIGTLKYCWLSLDEADSDPMRFLLYLVSALQTVAPNLGEGLVAALQTPQPPPAKCLLIDLSNEIAGLPDKLILVLDDYHLLDSPSVDAALAFLLDHIPPPLHLVIASREDPNLALPRLRAGGQLTELRAADLRFTPAEAAEFLNRVMGLKLSNADVIALEARTEGWIAGLQLAAVAMQTSPATHGETDPTAFIQSFTGSHRFVLDYLLEEVLQRQPEHVQNFLLRTAILNRLCGPLCGAVLGEPASSVQQTLETLERANLFIVPLDQERRWYRYHHLFGDLLRQRLGKPDEFPGLHLRASAWYEANGDLNEAFRHALAAEDFERAAYLAEAAWPGMEGSFQSAAWVGWVKKLPETVVRTRPGLCYQIGRAFSDMGEPETSEKHLQNAENALAEAPHQAEFTPLPGDIALTRAYNAQVQGKLAETIQHTEQALQLIRAEDVYRRAQAAITLELTHWTSGNLEAALDAICDWMDIMTKLGNSVFVVASAFAAADLLSTLGRLRAAKAAYDQALGLAAAQGREVETITAHHHLGLAMLAHEWGHDETATRHLQEATKLDRQTTLVDWPSRWQIAQSRLKESAGEVDAAIERLDEAQRVYIKNPIPDTQPIEAQKARLYLKQGRLDKARAWMQAHRLSTSGEVTYLGEYEHLTLVRVLTAEKTFAGVDELLERLLVLAEAQKRAGSAIEILLTRALAYQAQGNQSQAVASLERALTLAEPEGYLRTFTNEGKAMWLLMADLKTVIEKQPRNAVHPLRAYVEHILASFPQAVTARTPEIDAHAHPHNPTSETLSPRELEILHLVAQGLSNAEIGRRLYLALSTVKGHNLRIFAKLQAQNRTEAVARARELGLVKE
ncbi:MAG: LuxR C-terminal-related transcriptional regulator [Chloroflexota bacterium]